MPVFMGIAANTDVNRFDMESTIIPDAYCRAVERTGAVPIILPRVTDKETIAHMLSRVDGLIIPGGFDIEPKHFGQQPHPALGKVFPNLDLFQLELVRRAAARKMPMLGVCRGAQLINVAFGGSLYQDIPSSFPDSTLVHTQTGIHFATDHEVRFTPGSRLHNLFGPSIQVNSRHHQSIFKAGEGIKITATAPDGVIEGAEHQSLPIDLVQWHPEMMTLTDDTMMPLFERLTRACQEK